MPRIALAAAAVALVVLGAASAASDPVRLVAEPSVSRASSFVLLSGLVEGGAGNHDVFIEERWCGESGWSRPVTAHVHGRLFDLRVLPLIRTSYRARWRGFTSDPVIVRVHPEVRFVQVPGKRFEVELVAMRFFGGKTGRFERLDRARGWVLVKPVRLKAMSSAGSFAHTVAEFTTTLRKGTPVRFVLPAAAAAPCYGGAASAVRIVK